MKKIKRKVQSRRAFVRMVALAGPALIVANVASALEPMQDINSNGRTPRKKAVTKKAPARKKASKKKATRRPGEPAWPQSPM